jgi:HK97 family phage major capsid protein
MSDYDKLVARGDVVMDEENLNEVIEQAIQQSVFLSMGRRLRNMTTSELRLKVLSAIPDVYFVGEKGVSKTYPSSALKKTTEVTWKDVDVKAAELAAIVVFPKNVVADGQYDITAETKKQLAAAIAKKVDEAVLFGTQDSDSPSDWPTGIYTGMPAAHVIEYGELGDVYDDLAGIDGVIAQVE